jgi:two-component system CheB/CheR fusion protein
MCHHPYVADSSPAGLEVMRDADEAAFATILATVHGASGVDFSLYRERTIKRRILRRLALRNIDSLAEYAAGLEDDSDELGALQRDLLISVTSFFRDPGSFESLKTLVFPRMLLGRPPQAPIRIWVPGCATGEEAFSIAISLSEFLNETGVSFPVQIFASDISEPAIEKARAGRYLENIAADMSTERLNRYFTKVDTSYQINKNLREMCVFTRHNLLTDPPFSKLDLVSCRNVLIYLASVQKNIIPLFHYALRPNGFGNSRVPGAIFFSGPRTPDLRQAGKRAQALPVSHRIGRGLR